MGASRSHRDRANGVDLIQLFNVGETGHLRLVVVAPFEHLMEIHPSHTLGGFVGVVIVVDIDHQRAQQVADFVRHLNLQRSQFTGFDVLSDVVVGEERHACGLKPLADPARHLGTQSRLAVAVGDAIAGAIGHERDGGGHGYSFRRRRQPA